MSAVARRALDERAENGFRALFGAGRGSGRARAPALPDTCALWTEFGWVTGRYHAPGETVWGEPVGAPGAVSFHHPEEPDGGLEWAPLDVYVDLLRPAYRYQVGDGVRGLRPVIDGDELDRLRAWLGAWARRAGWAREDGA